MSKWKAYVMEGAQDPTSVAAEELSLVYEFDHSDPVVLQFMGEKLHERMKDKYNWDAYSVEEVLESFVDAEVGYFKDKI